MHSYPLNLSSQVEPDWHELFRQSSASDEEEANVNSAALSTDHTCS